MDTQTQTPPAGGAPDGQQSTPPAIFADGLNFAPDWHKALPEEFHGLAKDARSLPDVFARLKGSRDELAARGTGLKIPGEKATDDERAAFTKELYRHLGVPETPDAYDLTPPDGMEADKKLIDMVAKLGPEIGLTKAGASKLAEAYNAQMAARIEKVRSEEGARLDAERKELAAELGDKADSAVAMVKAVAKRNGWPEEVMDPTNENFVGAQAFKLIHSLASELAVAQGGDRTGQQAGSAGSRAKDADWALRVQQGQEPESDYIKDRAHPKYDETWRAIHAAYAAKHPGKK